MDHANIKMVHGFMIGQEASLTFNKKVGGELGVWPWKIFILGIWTSFF